MNATATAIVPTTGAPTLRQAVESVMRQTEPTTCLVVVDGATNVGAVTEALRDFDALYDLNRLEVCVLPRNVGANGFYGHRVYASFPHLVDTEHVAFLDEDCWWDDDHVATCLRTMRARGGSWCHALRRVVCVADGRSCDDDFESIGVAGAAHGTQLVDTNCYFLRTDVAVRAAHAIHGGWGADRALFSALLDRFPDHACTGRRTVNYRASAALFDFIQVGSAAAVARYAPEPPPWINHEI